MVVKLVLGLALAFTANAAMAEFTEFLEIGGITYDLDTENKIAKIFGCDRENSPTNLNVDVVEYLGETYAVTLVGNGAFSGCSSLKTVSLPSVTSIGDRAFYYCESLESVLLPSATSVGEGAFLLCGVEELFVPIGLRGKLDNCSISAGTHISYLPEELIAVPQGTQIAGRGEKVVPQDAQVVQEGEVAVKETELQAAKAETVQIADGVVSLAVGVCSNGNFTAETKDWKPVELKPENVKVENGKVVISIPVSDKSGFMILQSGDAKVSDAAVTHEPWYTPTVED